MIFGFLCLTLDTFGGIYEIYVMYDDYLHCILTSHLFVSFRRHFFFTAPMSFILLEQMGGSISVSKNGLNHWIHIVIISNYGMIDTPSGLPISNHWI